MSLVDPHDDHASHTVTASRSLLSLDLETPAPRTTGDRTRRTATIVVGALLVTLLLAATGFWFTGGRWFVVRTPSMGTAAPVGTLVLSRPTSVADLHLGDVVTFHPGDAALTYTHRVVAITGDHVTTRGDINGSDDPWRTSDRQLIGKAVAIVPGIGYAVRALPLLVIGGLLVVGLTRWWLRADRRGPLRLAGSTCLYVVAALVIRPFVAVRQLETTNGPDGAAITTVSTGILPVKIEALPGHGTATPVHLTYGEVGTLHFSGPADDNRYALMAHVDLSWTGWAVLAVLWSLPVLWVLIIGFRRFPVPDFTAGLADPPRVDVAATA